jgi:uncharacterized protein YlxW (UPF0749 family)
MSLALEIAFAVVGGVSAGVAWVQSNHRALWREKYDRAVTALQEQQAQNEELSAKVRDLIEANDTFDKVDEERDAALKELRALKRAAKAAGVKLTKPKRRTGKAKR